MMPTVLLIRSVSSSFGFQHAASSLSQKAIGLNRQRLSTRHIFLDLINSRGTFTTLAGFRGRKVLSASNGITPLPRLYS